MAKVTIQRRWPDGDVLSIVIKAENTYPDALDQARKVAIDTYRQALGVTTADVDEQP